MIKAKLCSGLLSRSFVYENKKGWMQYSYLCENTQLT